MKHIQKGGKVPWQKNWIRKILLFLLEVSFFLIEKIRRVGG